MKQRARTKAVKAQAKALAIDIERRERALMRSRVQLARAARTRALKRIRSWARKRLAWVTEVAAQERRNARERIRVAAEKQRAAVRERRELLRRNARRRFGAELQKRLDELAKTIAEHRIVEQRERGALRKRNTARERRAESDDRVRHNLPRELEGVFDAVRTRIKGSAKLSRTEAFLHWAHEHPAEVIEIQAKQAERDVERMIAEHHEEERSRVRGTIEANWRRASWRNAVYEMRAEPDGAGLHQVRVEPRQGKPFEALAVANKHGHWELVRVTKGRPTAAEKRGLGQWLSTFEGKTFADDLADVPF